MKLQKKETSLSVWIHGKPVGHWVKKQNGSTEFQYTSSWLKSSKAFPISLSMPLQEGCFSGNRVINVFENLLPDHDELRRRLMHESKALGSDAFSLLSAVGRDCIGSVQFFPDGERKIIQKKIIAKPLTHKKISEILLNLKISPLGVNMSDDFRISLAGAQEKTALLFWKKKWFLPLGSTPTSHILKPQIGKLPNGLDFSQSVENESICMNLLSAFGIPTAQTSIKTFNQKKVLVVKRFDRVWKGNKQLYRIPQEDCCQALSFHPALKYESEGGPSIKMIMDLLKGSDTPERDRKTFFKTQILFWLLAATDGHAKNFSIFLFPKGSFQLAPIYDVLSMQPQADLRHIQRNKMKMAMAVGINRHYKVSDIMPRHFIQTAHMCNMSEDDVKELFREILEQSEQAIESMPGGQDRNNRDKIFNSIINGFKKRLKLLSKI